MHFGPRGWWYSSAILIMATTAAQYLHGYEDYHDQHGDHGGGYDDDDEHDYGNDVYLIGKTLKSYKKHKARQDDDEYFKKPEHKDERFTKFLRKIGFYKGLYDKENIYGQSDDIGYGYSGKDGFSNYNNKNHKFGNPHDSHSYLSALLKAYGDHEYKFKHYRYHKPYYKHHDYKKYQKHHY